MDTESPHEPEKILWTGRQSHWLFLGHWMLGLAVVAGLVAALVFYRAEIEPWKPWVYAAPVVALLLLLAVVAFARGQRRYRVTSRRVIAEFGRVSRDTTEIRIQDIRSMNVNKSGLTGLLGVGKVEFSSAATDDADVIFYQIGGADGVRDLVRRLQS